MKFLPWTVVWTSLLAAAQVRAGAADKRLDIYWVDAEGGAATLIVTPAGESVLVDAGSVGPRDAGRIFAAATRAGLRKIDHLIITHFHTDHFGGVATLTKLMPVGTLYDDIAALPASRRGSLRGLADYQTAKVDRRVLIEPGATIALRQTTGAARIKFQFLAVAQRFAPGKRRPSGNACRTATRKDPDTSENANSAVMVLDHGPFRFFDGGDLSWNLETQLVCPEDRVGQVDVYQTTHHGVDRSNNPVLIATLAPAVAVINNGPRHGGEAGTYAALAAQPGIQAIYQLHRNVQTGPGSNTRRELIANTDEACTGQMIEMSADPQGETYVVSVPSTRHARTYRTKKK